MPSPTDWNAPGKNAAVESCSISVLCLEIGAEFGGEKGWWFYFRDQQDCRSRTDVYEQDLNDESGGRTAI